MARTTPDRAKNGSPQLLIIDPHRLFRSGVIRLLAETSEFGQIRSVDAVDEAISMITHFASDVALLSTTLLDGSPFDVVKRIHEASPRVKVLLLDDAVRPLYIRLALQVGAAGYWTKHDTFDEVRDAFHQASRGRVSFCPAAHRYLVPHQGTYRFEPPDEQSRLTRLTRRELEVVLHLAQGHSVRDTATRMHVAPSTVDNHKARAMRKMDIHKVVDLAILAMREGLIQ